jgi:hypothetical protein
VAVVGGTAVWKREREQEWATAAEAGAAVDAIISISYAFYSLYY